MPLLLLASDDLLTSRDQDITPRDNWDTVSFKCHLIRSKRKNLSRFFEFEYELCQSGVDTILDEFLLLYSNESLAESLR